MQQERKEGVDVSIREIGGAGGEAATERVYQEGGEEVERGGCPPRRKGGPEYFRDGGDVPPPRRGQGFSRIYP